ncbi:cell division protein ZapE [Galbitalea sp. SE-J8]|uniref:cell division protein ZapE n=1 Tax=Galbitalea sp. SE-J8 TaxID=3054952 RepID=UPI00259CF7F0|nr:cell division protein ZapE [Galbitalea sp. SE-J8]MDM4763213.1 cell division protein ZapE [Galbitalea sp. SE-J8]
MTESTAASARSHLVDIDPQLSGAEMVEQLVPPRQFADATLDSYRPDPDHPSQGEALEAMRAFAAGSRPGGFFSRRRQPDAKPGIYLDGGFGVGKTHLLAALWHATGGRRKYFGTFIEYTALVGALGYAGALAALTGAALICIDEFELDDPGDTRLMSRLLRELVASGTRIAATSNTPPNALGEGRFAAQDFLREIDQLAGQFSIMRIDGLDYRRRDIEGHAQTTDAAAIDAIAARLTGTVTVDDFDALLAHLARVHPSKYVKLVAGIDTVVLTGVHELANQTDALRLVAFVDRLYDAQIPVVSSGIPLDEVFAADMLAGGYRKKYLRAMSRLIALTTGAGL